MKRPRPEASGTRRSVSPAFVRRKATSSGRPVEGSGGGGWNREREAPDRAPGGARREEKPLLLLARERLRALGVPGESQTVNSKILNRNKKLCVLEGLSIHLF